MLFLDKQDDAVVGLNEGTLEFIKERFNIISPISCIQTHQDCADLFVFSLKSPDAFQLYWNNPDILQRFLFYYKEKAKPIIDQSKILMPKIYFENKITHRRTILSEKSFEHELIIKHYWLNIQHGEVKLTKNEYKILTNIGHGLETKEIALATGKAEGTIKNIIISIKEKTQLSRKSDLRKLFWNNQIIRI